MLKKMDMDKADMEYKYKNKRDEVHKKKAKKARSSTEAGDLNAGSVGRRRRRPSCSSEQARDSETCTVQSATIIRDAVE